MQFFSFLNCSNHPILINRTADRFQSLDDDAAHHWPETTATAALKNEQKNHIDNIYKILLNI